MLLLTKEYSILPYANKNFSEAGKNIHLKDLKLAMIFVLQHLELTSEAGLLVNTACGIATSLLCPPMAILCLLTRSFFPQNFVESREVGVCAGPWFTETVWNKVFGDIPEVLTLL